VQFSALQHKHRLEWATDYLSVERENVHEFLLNYAETEGAPRRAYAASLLLDCFPEEREKNPSRFKEALMTELLKQRPSSDAGFVAATVLTMK